MVLEISFAKQLFSPDAVKNAAIRFADVVAVDFRVDDKQIICALKFLVPLSDSEQDRISNELRVRVLDEDLRLRLREQTEPIRNAILAHVFSRTGLQGNE